MQLCPLRNSGISQICIALKKSRVNTSSASPMIPTSSSFIPFIAQRLWPEKLKEGIQIFRGRRGIVVVHLAVGQVVGLESLNEGNGVIDIVCLRAHGPEHLHRIVPDQRPHE
ncbi:hypothetical protein ACHAW5_007126 [Stephanodiscus triporus]|uniref:Uncharacterized protein n=1 Tax=Stephanodiscus triporus TaxID=2934178 RepID=A0ABD3NXX8_9STRA